MENTHYVQDSSSSVMNTILIIVLIVVLAGLGIWWYRSSANQATVPSEDSDLNIDVNLPSGSGGADTGGADEGQ